MPSSEVVVVVVVVVAFVVVVGFLVVVVGDVGHQVNCVVVSLGLVVAAGFHDGQVVLSYLLRTNNNSCWKGWETE